MGLVFCYNITLDLMKMFQRFAAFSIFLFASFSALSQSQVDYDVDDDGLIEVSTLAQFDAIRFDLDGNGYVDDVINDVSYMEAFGDLLVSGPPCVGYELISDIDLGGSTNNWETIRDFSADLDGGGYIISGLYIYIDRSDADPNNHIGSSRGRLGLFGRTAATAILRNFNLVDVDVTVLSADLMSLGGLVSYNRGIVEDSYVSGTMMRSGNMASTTIGGLVGENTGDILRSVSAVAVTSTLSGAGTGGLVGEVGGNGSVVASYATGDVVGGGIVGGLVGFVSEGSVKASYATGNVTANSTVGFAQNHVGGLVGANGGFFGAGTIEASYATGDVLASSLANDVKNFAGGLVGYLQDGTINASYAIGGVSIVSVTSFPGVSVVVDVDDREGGLVGRSAAGAGTISASYYLDDTTPSTDDTDASIQRKTATALQSPTSAMGIYVDWSSYSVPGELGLSLVVWDFGGTGDYPMINPQAIIASPQVTSPVETPELYDTDGDFLIEVHNLAQLNAIRFDCDGNGNIDNGDIMHFSTGKGGYADTYVDAFGYNACPIEGYAYEGYELMAPIDFGGSGTPWEPIGNNSNRFLATFNGNGFVMSDLHINLPITDYVGLFGYVQNATICNVHLSEVDVTGNDRVGGLVGRLEASTITASYVTGTVVGLPLLANDYVGGLVGYVYGGMITASYSAGTVTASGTTSQYTGGLVGYVTNVSTIAASYSTATVSGGRYVGGLVGYGTSIPDLYATYARGDVIATGNNAGGLAGFFSGEISASYATGDVTGTSASSVRGLVGAGNFANISSSCYFLGATIMDANGIVPPDEFARSSAQLAAITTASYPGWGVDIDGDILPGGDPAIVWDFVTLADDDAYPLLRVDFDGDTSTAPTSLEFVADMAELDALKLPFSEVGFRQATATVSEGDPPMSFFIDAYVPVGRGTLTYSISVGDSTADIDTDYTILPLGPGINYVGLLDGEISFNFSVVDDTMVEGDEEVVLTLMVAAGSEGATAISSMRLTIEDNENSNPYDTDGNGLIEVHDLEQLSVIRCDLDGDGEIDDLTSYNSAVPGTKAFIYVRAFGYGICPPNEDDYVGYELAAALDFAGTRWALNATAANIPDAVFEGWEPIGPELDEEFHATFNGNGHTITGLCINRDVTDYVGLFGYVGVFGSPDVTTISNVRLAEVNVVGNSYVGSLVGRLENAIISNVHLAGVDVTGYDFVGGLAGYVENLSTIAASYSTGTVSATRSGADSNLGGLVGYVSESTIAASYSTGTVTSVGDYVGGLVGNVDDSTITASYSTATVSGDWNVGGLVGGGDSTSILRASYARGNVTSISAGSPGTGGLAGFFEGSISSSYATGDVTGGSDNVRGLVGSAGSTNFANISSSCYFLGATIMDANGIVPPDVFARSSAQLAAITIASYPAWGVDIDGMLSDDASAIVWDFVTDANDDAYPLLRVDFDGDTTTVPTSLEFVADAAELEALSLPFSEIGFRLATATVNEEDPPAKFFVDAYVPSGRLSVEYSVVVDPSSTTMPDDCFVDFEGRRLNTATVYEAKNSGPIPFDFTVVDDDILEGDEFVEFTLMVADDSEGTTVISSMRFTIEDNEDPYDLDGDFLIEVHNLAQLNVIRFDLNGDGNMDSRTGANHTMGGGGHADDYVAAFTYGVCPIEGYPYEGYELIAPIDFAGNAREPIGNNSNPFRATFNGNGNVISNLHIDLPSTDYVGLFGSAQGAAICNVHLVGVNVIGDDYVGGLVGRVQDGSVVTASYSTGTVVGDTTNGPARYVGGLVGYVSNSAITASYSTGTVTASGNSFSDSTGGLVGYISGFSTIAASYSTATVSGVHFVGGLVGYGDGSPVLYATYARGDVISAGNSAGGLVGYFEADISASYATGDVMGNNNVRGLVGSAGSTNFANISSSCYFLGATIMDANGIVPPDICARSSAQLAAITTASDTAWGVDIDGNILSGGDPTIVWDFVTDADDDAYPLLRADFDGDTNTVPTSLEFVADMAELDALNLPFTEVGFRQATATVSEGDAPVSFFIDTYVPAGRAALTYSYSISVSDSTADIDDDYTIGQSLPDIDHGTTTTGFRQFGFSVEDDDEIEGDEVVVFTLMVAASSEGATAISSMRLTIEDNENSNPYDTDGDFLIEVHNLAQLNVIRFDCDGDGNIDNGDIMHFSTGKGGYADDYVAAFTYGACPIEGYPYEGYELVAPIDFGGSVTPWEPIGKDANHFRTTFNGNGFVMSNLYINRPSTDHVGLFGIASVATICNVHLAGVEVTGGDYVGGLAGAILSSSLTASCVTGTVVGDTTNGSANYVGGLVGILSVGAITASYSTGTVTASGGSAVSQYTGGLVGYASIGAIIAASYSTATVRGDRYVGGLVGYGTDAPDLYATYARGDVIATENNAGGLAGYFEGDISVSYATGDVMGNNNVRGLVGSAGSTNFANISSSCYFLGATVMDANGAVPPDMCARSSAQLAAITTASDTAWGVDIDGNTLSSGHPDIVWDFVTDAGDDVYPLLRVDFDGDTMLTSEEFVANAADFNALKLPFSEVGFRLATATVNEGDPPMSFFIDAYVPAGRESLTYFITVPDSTAEIVDDYTISSFVPGNSNEALVTGSFSFGFSVEDDDEIEGDEEVVFTLMVASTSEGATAISSMRLTIEDNEDPYDTDFDGLIEVHNLAQLDVIRLDLNGDGNMDNMSNANFYLGGGGHADDYVAAFGYGVCPVEGYPYEGYELMAPIDFGGSLDPWNPIGNNLPRFSATFNGNGNVMANLYIDRPSGDNVGLFGYVEGATICNVHLAGVDVIGGDYVGGLVGRVGGVDSIITSSYVTGTVSGSGQVGGLVGRIVGGTIAASYSTGTVSSAGDSCRRLGRVCC